MTTLKILRCFGMTVLAMLAGVGCGSAQMTEPCGGESVSFTSIWNADLPPTTLYEAEGLDEVFRAAGFEWRESGCSMCFYAGGESFGAGERVVSSTNRNFESRQGPATRTHIASPETVAASAIAGCIADARPLAARR